MVEQKIHNEICRRILKCVDILDFCDMYQDSEYQGCLKRLEQAQLNCQDKEDWSKSWAQQLSDDDSPYAIELNRDRRTSLELLYGICNRWKPSPPDESPPSSVSELDIVHKFKPQKIKRILSFCLPMDRANALYNMIDSTTSRRGLHWYAKEDTVKLQQEYATGNSAVANLRTDDGHTINKRLRWLFNIHDLHLRDDNNLSKWIQPTLLPTIPGGEDVAANNAANYIVASSSNNNTPPQRFSSISTTSMASSISTICLEYKTGTALLLKIPTKIRTQDVKTTICQPVENLVPRGDLDHYNPKIFISYATGNRPNQDDEGCGPGMYYTKALVDCFHNLGYSTFTGLHVGAFVNWKDHYLGKLNNDVAVVLIVVLTPAFFRSMACLEETYTAKTNGVKILPVSFEHPWIDKGDKRWPAATTEVQQEMKEVVTKELMETNSYPKPPNTVLHDPAEDLLEIFKKVNEILQRTPS